MSKPAATMSTAAPHIHSSQSQVSLVMGMTAAVMPTALWGIASFGYRAAIVLAAAVLSAVLAEGIMGALKRAFTLSDGSAFLTGLIIGLSMPPGVNYAVPVLASCFAILVVKWCFGGLGANWMNPAMAGVALAYLAWPGAMAAWTAPRGLVELQGMSSATPIALLRSSTRGQFAGSGIFVPSSGDAFATGALNDLLFKPLGSSLPSGYLDLLVGNRSGSIGEVSIILILLGSLWLIGRKIIRFEIPLAILLSYSLLCWSFGNAPIKTSFLGGDALFALSSGSVVFMAIFAAGDPVTSPIKRGGRIVYGLLIGFLCWAFRKAGSTGDGSAYAVIVANCLVPAIDSMGSKE